ncbi:MAG TPA: homoserine O-succinyltransferase [Gemmatimonadaceae bacterium]|nr:homoserine O-succinyltransferase [Gemmatimonadaceae bacterium]
MRVSDGAPPASSSASPPGVASEPARLPRAVEGEALRRDVTLEHGGRLAELRVGYRLYGDPSRPLVVVLGGISAGRHVTAGADDPRPGWWDAMVGEGRPIDTTAHAVLGLDWVGGSGATTGPAADAADAAGAAFPVVDTHDQATAVVMALDALGVTRAHSVVGASYGAMVALALCARHAARVGHAVVIAGAHESQPMATALRSLQRRIVRLGLAAGRPRDALVIARGLGMTTYRTAEEFAARFDQVPEWTAEGARFPVEQYLVHVGERYAAWATPESFLRLSESLDLHRVDPGIVTTPTTIIAVDSDTLVPLWQMRELRDALAGPAALHVLSSIYGHDAFLKEIERMGALIRAALAAA